MAATKKDPKGDRSVGDVVSEVWDLVRTYARQQTVDPLKGLLNFVKWGVIGSVLVGIGVLELTVAVLRAAQIEPGDSLDGNWTPVPYLITLVLAGVVLLLTKRAMSAEKPPTTRTGPR